MDKYRKKQVRIGLVYLLILVIIVGGVYFIIKSGLPSCSDGIQNQGEAGIDCGGPCPPCAWQLQKDLEVIFFQAIPTQENYVDLVARIRNPNSDFGAESFSYVFNLYDSEDKLIISRKGSSYILPRETRYFIEQKIKTEADNPRIEFKINNVKWQEVVEYQEPELLIKNLDFIQSEDLSQLSAVLENRSSYDFSKIDVWAVLFDSQSNILGVNKIELYTVLSEERRYFEMKWFFPLSGQVEKIETVAKTNVFLDENFMKRYGGKRERFQEY